MEGDIRTGLSPAEGRRFGLVVGAAFLVLALLLAWRQHLVAAQVAAAIGVTLAVAGVVVPGRLGPVHAAWMALALVISKVTTPVFMAVVYYAVLTPFGGLRRAFGWRVLRRDAEEGGSLWRPRDESARGDLTRQF